MTQKTVRGPLIAAAVIIAFLSGMSAQTKYGVNVTYDKKTDFAKFKTYRWGFGHQSPDPAVDKQIRASIERALAGEGLTKADKEPSDLIVLYDSMQRTDANLDAKGDADGRLPTYKVGVLIVALQQGDSKRGVFKGQIDKPLTVDRAALGPEIDSAVDAIFAKYPTKANK